MHLFKAAPVLDVGVLMMMTRRMMARMFSGETVLAGRAKFWAKLSAQGVVTLALGCMPLFLGTNSAAQQAKKPEEAPFTIQADVNRVLLQVVVRDKLGNIVDNLESEDFQILDNGKPHPISHFMIERRLTADPDKPGRTTSAQQSLTPPSAAARSSLMPPRCIVFIFDDLHLSIEDLARAKKAAAELLDGTLVDSNMAAVVSLSGKQNSGLTRDRAKLQDTIMSLQPRTLYLSSSADCPHLSYYQADLIENKNNDAAIQDAVRQILACAPTKPEIAENQAHMAARLVLLAGEQDVRVTFASIAEFVRRTGALPGQSILILVSPGFLTINPEALSAESHLIDLAARYNVVISALDARGVYVTDVTASDDTRGRSPGEINELRQRSMTQTESVMAELTDGTGGTYFHHNNDLGVGFSALTDTPRCVYLIELSPDDMKANGSYHRLKVKVDREGLQIQVRHGYFAPKPNKNKK
jgi:VWFA-related protein